MVIIVISVIEIIHLPSLMLSLSAIIGIINDPVMLWSHYFP